MNVLCVDDEPIVLMEIDRLLTMQPDISSTACFGTAEAALQWAKENQPDAAFLDINLGRMDGLTLAKAMRENCPECAIVFVTGYSEYAVDAYQLHAEGYLMKPATGEDVRRELDYIKAHRLRTAPKSDKRIRLQCFGSFEAFVDGEPLRFERGKTKELLAYLADRQGATCTMGELMGVLWEDAPDTLSLRSNLRNLISDLKSTLAKHDVGELILKGKNALSLNCSLVSCDYYDFLKLVPYAVNLYRGEYMSQYSWAEITTASLAMREY